MLSAAIMLTNVAADAEVSLVNSLFQGLPLCQNNRCSVFVHMTLLQAAVAAKIS